MSTDQDWTGLKPILAGSDCNFFLISGSGLDWTEKIYVVLM